MTSILRLLLALLFGATAGLALEAGTSAQQQAGEGAAAVAAQEVSPEPRRVLALYWYPSNHPSTHRFSQRFQAALKEHSGGRIEYYAEYFESARFPGESQARIMRDYLRQKYRDRRIDVLLAWGGVPLEFLLRSRSQLFPDTPIVYYVGTLEAIKGLAAPALTGVQNPDAYGKTLELALALHPDAKEAFIISGTPARDRLVEREASAQLDEYRGRIALTYLTDLPLDQLIATVKNLPASAIILFTRQSQEDPGRMLAPPDFLQLVSRAAPVPVYSPWSSALGHGNVGGPIDDPEAGAAKAAAIVLRILRGARPQDIPVERTPQIPTFDARQLRRWGISEDRLPPGSVVLFREPTAWEQYRGYVIGSAVVLLVQSLLIAGLLTQRRKRRRTEALLTRSEQRYALATAAAMVGVWEWNLETGELYIDPMLKGATGFSGVEIADRVDAWMDRVHAEDKGRVRAELQALLDGRTASYAAEYRILHRDGTTLWFLARGSVVRLPDGRAVKMVGSAIDITERKRAEARLHEAEEELARMSRLTALGEFATSIAHEVSQPLSAILMNSSACQRLLGHSPPPLSEIRSALAEIVDDCKRAKELMRRNRELFQHHTVEKLPLDINLVVRDVVRIARTRALHGNVTLGATLDENLPAVLGDRLELQQVVLNLLQNALDAVEPVDPRQRRIHIRSGLDRADMVRIEVQDAGVGLGRVDVGRIFMPLYTTKPSGTGVGLSISRSIVEAHGGRLWAEPNDGPGTCFVFTLPTAAWPMTTLNDGERSAAAADRSGRVA
jgi:PAS domain S-box-containing protein